MPVGAALGVEAVGAGELRFVEVARTVEAAHPVARLDRDPVPGEIALHAAARIDQRLDAQEFLDRGRDDRRVVAYLRLERRVQRQAPKHLADGRGDRVEPPEPEKPGHAEHFVGAQRGAVDAPVGDVAAQGFVGRGLLLSDKVPQVGEDAVHRGGLGRDLRLVEDVPFPRQELIEHREGKAHQVEEHPHREHPPKVVGDVDFAPPGEFVDHSPDDSPDAWLHRLHRHRGEPGIEELAVPPVIGRVDPERNRRPGLAGEQLELRHPLRGKQRVVLVDPADILVAGDHPRAVLIAAGGPGIVVNPRESWVAQDVGGDIGIGQIEFDLSVGEAGVEHELRRHVRGRRRGAGRGAGYARGRCGRHHAEANIFSISPEVTGLRALPTASMLSVFRPPRLCRGLTSTCLPSSRK